MTLRWQPCTDMEMLARRARLLQQVRAFMAERSILEVETPILNRGGNPDPNIANLMVQLSLPAGEHSFYLHTSPEFAMKRLLAAGSGPIFQIARVFRDGESGNMHEPEFSMLEWYRPGFDHHALMDEIEALLRSLQFAGCERVTYAEVFQHYAGLNPHQAGLAELQEKAGMLGLNLVTESRGMLLDFIFSHSVTVALGQEHPLFVYDYPACQASLARIRSGQPDLAERFELFISGMEIANGFNELCDSLEQKHRFDMENEVRHQAGLPRVCIDERFLGSLVHGLPPCAGVAVGLDRLLMALSGSKRLQDVIAFSPSRDVTGPDPIQE
ncbi:MAG: EF-P lysine aminoacylase EpmA [Gammaproteobacteria bacterium]